jgi:Ca2+-binding EF-hand superfamily protein
MASFRRKFENELRAKLQQKATPRLGEETILLKAFRFFDLDNSNTVNCEEFVKAIEKIGIIVENTQILQQIFQHYDTDRSGTLDYREFVAAIFGQDSTLARRRASSKQETAPQTKHPEDVLCSLRQKLIARGVRGMIGLCRQFRVFDDENSGYLDSLDLLKALRDYRLDIDETDLQLLVSYIDTSATGKINTQKFMQVLQGGMNEYRRSIVDYAYGKLDSQSRGYINLMQLRQNYDTTNHPQVRNGEITPDEALSEFLETFELHHNLNRRGENSVPHQEFVSYYEFVSAYIEDDEFFEDMMVNVWQLNAHNNKVQERKEDRRDNQLQALIEKFRKRLVTRGTRGIIGLAKQFRIMDDRNVHTLTLQEFRKACNDFRIGISLDEMDSLFRAMDRNNRGVIYYEDVIRAIIGTMSSGRASLVAKAWNKLDRDGEDVIDMNDLRSLFSAREHPDVKSGKKSEDEIMCEFFETFEMHHNLFDCNKRSRKVTREEFEEYYNNVSGTIDDDEYFEILMNSSWRLDRYVARPERIHAEYSSRSSVEESSSFKSWIIDHHRGVIGGSVIRAAPFGTTDEPIDYSTATRPSTRQEVDLLSIAQSMPAAGVPRWPVAGRYHYIPPPPANQKSTQELLKEFKDKIFGRGQRGLIGLKRQFKSIDTDNSGSLSLNEFISALREYRLNFQEEDARRLFQYFDLDRDGVLNYDEFLRRIRGEMSSFRKQLVIQAYAKLDRKGMGYIPLEEIKQSFSPNSHPDIRLGKKSEEEVLCDFLESFELFHNTFVISTQKDDYRDTRVTQDEFLEFYSTISSSIDDDRYFEMAIKSSWNFEMKTYNASYSDEMFRR